MALVLLDTSVCIDVLRGATGARRWLQAQYRRDCLVSAVVRFELEQGAWLARDPAAEQRRLEHFLGPLILAELDAPAAREAARIAAHLRRAGTPIGAYDVLIAGHALALGARVATRNPADFERVAGLDVVVVNNST